MPRVKLTKAVIDKIPHTDKGQLLIWDSELRGFGLCVGQNSKTFVVQRQINGRSRRIVIERYGVITAEQARRLAAENLFMMGQGIDPNEEKRARRAKSITLRELAEEFLKVRNNLKERTKADYLYNLEKYLADWMEKPVKEITEEKFQKRYFYIGEHNGPTSANNVKRILGSILTYAIAAHKLFDKNPVRIISDTKSAYPIKRRRTYIKPSQLPAVWKAIHADPHDTFRDYLILLLFTGLRRNEAAKIKWADIDFIDRTLTIRETKNGEVLILPLSDYIFDLLEKRRRRYGNHIYVFSGRGVSQHIEEPKKAVYRITKATGIKFTVHDLRRTFVSIAESLDVSMFALKHLVNHKIGGEITGSYVIMNVERLRAPVQRISDYILEAVAQKNVENNF